MPDELRLWAISDAPGEAVQITATSQTDETEKMLEDVFMEHPEMLLPELQLVGRQTLTRVGYPDLLGVDGEGRLVVFELKRRKLTREAISQLLSYGSHLESLAEKDLVALIERGSGSNGVTPITDFEDWYSDRIGRPRDNLRPLRMVLVGLGADEEARRIVEFLQGHGVRIDLLTFHGFSHAGKTILAVHDDSASLDDESPRAVRPRPTESQPELLRSLQERAKENGVAEFWDEAYRRMRRHSDTHYAKKSGITFCRHPPHLDLGGPYRVRAPFSLNLERDGRIRVTFFPGAVHLCFDEFTEAAEDIDFKKQPPANAPTTDTVSEEWFSLLTEAEWRLHGADLLALCERVAEAWKAAALEGGVSESQSESGA